MCNKQNKKSTLKFDNLPAVVNHLREDLTSKNKDLILIYGFNGTGKTRLSMSFRYKGAETLKNGIEGERISHIAFNGTCSDGYERDTLYYNAYVEDLFQWQNDVSEDTDDISHYSNTKVYQNAVNATSHPILLINKQASFSKLIANSQFKKKLNDFFYKYTGINFTVKIPSEEKENKHCTYLLYFHRTPSLQINSSDSYFYDNQITSTSLETKPERSIKISRGEENIFKWCFYLAIFEYIPHQVYAWVKYVYIDDPVSSLDENNVVGIACDLAKVVKELLNKGIKVIISTHHTLFYNVLCNELKKCKHKKYFFDCVKGQKKEQDSYTLQDTSNTPNFYHISMLKKIKADINDNIITIYHFNLLRSIMEKTSSFVGNENFSECISDIKNQEEYARILNLLSHQDHSLFNNEKITQTDKDKFKAMFNSFISEYKFKI